MTRAEYITRVRQYRYAHALDVDPQGVARFERRANEQRRAVEVTPMQAFHRRLSEQPA